MCGAITMTTGAKIAANVPSEYHATIVSKARALAVKDPLYRTYNELQDELNMMLINAALPAVTTQHKVGHLDLIEQLNKV
jgi:hypothetical protein